MGRPLIGLTTYAEPQRFTRGELPAVGLPAAYVQAVNTSGGRAVLLPSDDPGADLIGHLDGLVLCGGSDLDPAYYGEPPHESVVVRQSRDRAEMLFLRAALARDLPVLGVCRGLQLMAVEYGGRLHQHLPAVLGTDLHRPVTEPGYGGHDVRIERGSLAERILGDRVSVNSFHHQGIADSGRLVPTGWSVEDGLIEVAEDPEHTFVFGVQWHPEDSTDHRMFAALVEAADAALSAAHRS